MDYTLNQKVSYGKGSTESLSRFKNENVVIITDPFLAENGMASSVAAAMPECTVSIYSEIKPDPTIDQIAACTKFVKEHDAKVIVAFGGGSSIDTAKGVVLVVMKEIPREDITFVAIPTTSGTGSEVTSFTVVTNSETGVKSPIIDTAMVPDLAILDYMYTMSVPASVTADTGMDVITHAIEGFVAKNSSPMSDAFAEKAAVLAFENLLACYKDGSDETARYNMQMASYMAGLCFTTAGLGINHSLAHATGAAFHLPHGRLNAIFLPHVISFNACLDKAYSLGYSETSKRYALIAKRIGLPPAGVRQGVNNLIDEINKMNVQMKIPRTLMQAGVKRPDYLAKRSVIISNAMADACTAANPREVTENDLGIILDKAFGGI